MSVLLQQSYGEGPHYGEHRDLPSHNSISSSPFLGPGLVGKCLPLPRRCGMAPGGSNRERCVLTGSVCTAQHSCFPPSDPLQKGLSELWLKGLLARGAHQCLMCAAASGFYVRDYFSLFCCSTQGQ